MISGHTCSTFSFHAFLYSGPLSVRTTAGRVRRAGPWKCRAKASASSALLVDFLGVTIMNPVISSSPTLMCTYPSIDLFAGPTVSKCTRWIAFSGSSSCNRFFTRLCDFFLHLPCMHPAQFVPVPVCVSACCLSASVPMASSACPSRSFSSHPSIADSPSVSSSPNNSSMHSSIAAPISPRSVQCSFSSNTTVLGSHSGMVSHLSVMRCGTPFRISKLTTPYALIKSFTASVDRSRIAACSEPCTKQASRCSAQYAPTEKRNGDPSRIAQLTCLSPNGADTRPAPRLGRTPPDVVKVASASCASSSLPSTSKTTVPAGITWRLAALSITQSRRVCVLSVAWASCNRVACPSCNAFALSFASSRCRKYCASRSPVSSFFVVSVTAADCASVHVADSSHEASPHEPSFHESPCHAPPWPAHESAAEVHAPPLPAHESATAQPCCDLSHTQGCCSNVPCANCETLSDGPTVLAPSQLPRPPPRLPPRPFLPLPVPCFPLPPFPPSLPFLPSFPFPLPFPFPPPSLPLPLGSPPLVLRNNEDWGLLKQSRCR